jgi:hypothetical protein
MNGFALGAVGIAYGAQVSPLTLLGVNAFTLVWNLAFSHLRHSHIALPFPRWLSYILVSPHMHQAHHSADAAQHDKNFATVFALWDWMFGTLYLPAKGNASASAWTSGPEPERRARRPALHRRLRGLTLAIRSATGPIAARRGARDSATSSGAAKRGKAPRASASRLGAGRPRREA